MKLWQAFVKMWKSECTVCGCFTPGKMKKDGVCLYCVYDLENPPAMDMSKLSG